MNSESGSPAVGLPLRGRYPTQERKDSYMRRDWNKDLRKVETVNVVQIDLFTRPYQGPPQNEDRDKNECIASLSMDDASL